MIQVYILMPKIEAMIITPNQHTANGNIIGMNMIITPIKAIVPKPSASPTLQVIMINIYNISLLELRLSNYLIRYPLSRFYSGPQGVTCRVRPRRWVKRNLRLSKPSPQVLISASPTLGR